mgnify:CR=1 FL=1
MKTILTGILLSGTLLLFGRNTRTISINVSIEPTQRLTLLSSTEFPELAANHLDLGYNQLEGCVELEVKSNVPWVLIAYNDSFNEQTKNNYKKLLLSLIIIVTLALLGVSFVKYSQRDRVAMHDKGFNTAVFFYLHSSSGYAKELHG